MYYYYYNAINESLDTPIFCRISLFPASPCHGGLPPDNILFSFFLSFISLIADGPHHYHPTCGHKGSSHLSPVHALQFFYRDASSALLQLVNQWLNFTYSLPTLPLRKKEHKSCFGKNRTHDFRISRCADYLLDHSGDECDLLRGPTRLGRKKYILCPKY